MSKEKCDFEEDLKSLFGDKMKFDVYFCKQIWSSLANVTWKNKKCDMKYAVSFRYAGGLIAEIRGEGDYMDWYCSGEYATVTDEIKKALAKKGWKPEYYSK